MVAGRTTVVAATKKAAKKKDSRSSKLVRKASSRAFGGACDNCDIITVYIAARLRRVFNVDTVEETFGCQYTFVMCWLCPSFETPPTAEEDDGDWMPEFTPHITVANLVEDGVSSHSFSIKKIDGRKWIYGELNRNQTIYENMELQSFPADVQDLTLSVICQQPTSRVQWMPMSRSGFVTLEKIALNDLRMVREMPFTAQVTTIVDPYDKLERSMLEVHVKVARGSKYYLYNLFLVLSCICTCSLCSYSLHAGVIGGRLGVDLAVLLTVVAFQLVISDMVPPLNYFTLMHKYVLGSFVFVIAQTCLHCVTPTIGYINANELSSLTLPPNFSSSEEHLLLIDFYIFVVSAALWALFNVAYFVYFRIHKQNVYKACVADAKRKQAEYDHGVDRLEERLKKDGSEHGYVGPKDVKCTRMKQTADLKSVRDT